jgi:hypothetical protein
MPSTSKKQHNFMEAIAHNKAFAKKVGVPQSVGRDFSNADKGKTFKKGGDTMASKMDPKMMAVMKQARNPRMPVGGRMAKNNQPMSSIAAGMSEPGTPAMMKKGGKVKKMAEGGKVDKTQDKAMIKKAFGMHDKQEHKGEHTNLSKLKKGGMTKMAAGGSFRSSANGVASKGKTKGTMVKMAKGGKYC